MRTIQPAASTGIASFSARKHLKQTRKTDWRHCIIELYRMCQFQQHYVVGVRPSWSTEFLADDEFTDRNANSVLVRLRPTILTNDHDGFIVQSGLKSVQQRQNYC